MSIGGSYAGNLRRELCSRSADFASRHGFAHVQGCGREPVIVFAPGEDSGPHGNFFPASYKAIQKNANWRMRLNKVHAQARTLLPKSERRWRELDSCTSSDALLMNIFCCPRVLRARNLAAMMGVDPASRPTFGYRPRVPLANGHIDRTEVDLKLGNLLIESKLTESDFQTQSAALVENYCDLQEVFHVDDLPRLAATAPIDPFPDEFGVCQTGIPRPALRRILAQKTELQKTEIQTKGARYVSYQLIRNVLAAHAAGESFCVIIDQRRPDLIERWHRIMRCIRSADLRTRCKVLTWQELAAELPSTLQTFLAYKYGIETAQNIFNSSAQVAE